MSDQSVRRGQSALDELSSQRPHCFGEVVLTNASDVQIKPVDWLWPDFLPRGMLTLLAGLPGCGKSTLALAFAATITSAGRWPCGSRQTRPGSVLIWSSEDAIDVTLTPRLKAMGADLSRCHFVAGISHASGVDSFDPSKDIPKLTSQIERIGDVSMLVLDPVLSAVSGDSHKAAETRRGLQSVVDLASKHNIAVLGITHFSKGSAGASPAERVIGSQAFSALARMVLVAAKVQTETDDESKPPQRIIARAKSNISADDGGFSFNLELIEIQRGIVAQRVTWGEAIKGSALALLNDAEKTEEDGDESSALDDACEFLKQALAGGQALSKRIDKDARGAGISRRTLMRARSELKVKATKSAMLGGWVLELPKSAIADQECQETQPGNVGTLGTLREKATERAEGCQGCQEFQTGEVGTLADESLAVELVAPDTKPLIETPKKRKPQTFEATL
jgi:putative DNA primase/helicase